MQNFLVYIRRTQKKLITEYGDALSFCRELLTETGVRHLPKHIADLFLGLQPDERYYAIASSYSILIGEPRRHELSAYFTPPTLCRAVLEASKAALDKHDNPSVLDPACGGGAFLTPIARLLIAKKIAQGWSTNEACANVLKNVRGIEIDPGLAVLSQALLRHMLAQEYDFRPESKLCVVHEADALLQTPGKAFDLIVGNPPFGKIGTDRARALIADRHPANMGGHTNVYALFLLRSLGWTKPGGSLVFVLPTSFAAGPYFASLREQLLKQAEVVRIDLHERRENLFLGAVQDICILSLRRRKIEKANNARLNEAYELGVIDTDGELRSVGSTIAKNNGEPWILPVAHQVKPFTLHVRDRSIAKPSFTLFDYGYRVRVGNVVPTRERQRLHIKPLKGDLPLLWASAVRPDESFDFEASDRIGNARWYSPQHSTSPRFNMAHPAVILQRTSNRDQARRLNATHIPQAFRNQYKDGFVAENHVIVIEALRAAPRISAKKIATLLNSAVVNERFAAVCGSFSISATLLAHLALPDPAAVSKLRANKFEHALRVLFAGMPDILMSERAGYSQTTIVTPSDLINEDAVNGDVDVKESAVTPTYRVR